MKGISNDHRKIAVLILLLLAAYAPAAAQNLGATVTISASQLGASFSVDGTNYLAPMSAVWPAGSKHTLAVQTATQYAPGARTRYTFGGWTANGQQIPGGGIVTVTADPSVTTYLASFLVEYDLTVNAPFCNGTPGCTTPGTVYVNNAPLTATDTFYSSGTSVQLVAVPNDGYVFGGWDAGPDAVVQGALNTVSMKEPVSVTPHFQIARTINLATIPAQLNVLADRTTVPTPSAVQWGWNTTHSVGAITPQMDLQGLYWVFQSWSDGGAPTHAYQVAAVTVADTLTATYVRGASVNFSTSPAGLKLTIDGRDNWPTYGFVWGVGETHHLSATQRVTDAQGRVYTFSAWSNGGAAGQDITVPASAADTGLRFVATYTPTSHITVTSTANITVKVDGVDCPTTCDLDKPFGAAVHVTAPGSLPVTDGVRQDFNGWPGSGSMSSDWTYTLGADPLSVNLTYHLMNRLAADSAPPNGASWTMQPASGDGYYDASSAVTVLVSALPGYRFRTFTGDLGGSKPAGVVAMNQPRFVHAQLDRVPFIAPAGIGNGAGNTPQTGVAAGSVVSIFGQSLAADTVTGPTSPLAQTLDGVTVQMAGRLLPIFFVSPTQINVQLPDDTPAGTPTLTVSSAGNPDVQASFTVVRNAPGLFGQTVQNQSFAVAFHQDGTPVTTDAPAQHGELLTVYGTGLGPSSPSRPEGFAVPSTPGYMIQDSVSVSIGSSTVSAENAFAAPGRVAIDAVQFRLGDDAPTATNATLSVQVNGQNSNTVLLPVQ
jgi:uncharacterized protein (TIGR03437 family)